MMALQEDAGRLAKKVVIALSQYVTYVAGLEYKSRPLTDSLRSRAWMTGCERSREANLLTGKATMP
jgi:hypothetical protein